MTLQERQQYLYETFHGLEGINRRRAYKSTLYAAMRDRYRQTQSEDDRRQLEEHESELLRIDEHAAPLIEKLRGIQTRYLVEYEGTEGNVDGMMSQCREELFFLTYCDLDTFAQGWQLERDNVQDLLYEIADFLLEHRFSRFFIRNVKRL